MSLAHALLGLINYHPATGYDLKSTFNESIHFFWDATLPQIYRTLAQMEESGWVSSRIEHQAGKPSKKIYEITEGGKGEFGRWLREPLAVSPPRVPMLVKVFFGNQMAPVELKENVQQWRDYHEKLLGRYEEHVDAMIDQLASASGLPQDARYWRMTLDFGKRHARMVIEWCDKLLKDLGKERGLQKGPRRST